MPNKIADNDNFQSLEHHVALDGFPYTHGTYHCSCGEKIYIIQENSSAVIKCSCGVIIGISVIKR